MAEDPAAAAKALAVAGLLAVPAAPARADARTSTRSPAANELTPRPTSSMVPTASWPSTVPGRHAGHVALEDVQIGAADRRACRCGRSRRPDRRSRDRRRCPSSVLRGRGRRGPSSGAPFGCGVECRLFRHCVVDTSRPRAAAEHIRRTAPGCPARRSTLPCRGRAQGLSGPKPYPRSSILLSLAAIGVTTLLQARADAGRDAQLKLEELEGELTQLQNAPFKASPRTGGSPAFAGKLMDERQAPHRRRRSPSCGTTRRCRRWRESRPAEGELRGARRDLRDRRLGRRLRPARRRAVGHRRQGDGRHHERARRGRRRVRPAASATLFRSRTGSKLAILLLALAFAFFYRRAARLAAANYQEARTDSLTGLPNRRALVDDLEPQLPRAGGDRAGRARALRSRRLQAVQRHLRPPRRRRAARSPRRAPGGRGRRRRHRLPDGRRRVLRARRRPGRARRRSSRSPPTRFGAGDAFDIGCSYGTVLLPARGGIAGRRRCDSPTSACTRTRRGRASASRQSTRRAAARSSASATPSCASTSDGVAQLAEQTAAAARAPDARGQARSRSPPSCTTSARPRSPTRSSTSPARSTTDEWEFMHRHTIIGERILAAAPSLAPAAGSCARATSASTAPATPTR